MVKPWNKLSEEVVRAQTLSNFRTRVSHRSVKRKEGQMRIIGLYRDVWIAAIASSTTSLATRTAAICVRFQGRRVRRVYVTMQITFLTRKSALIYRRGLRQRVASLTLNCNGDFAIRAYYPPFWSLLFPPFGVDTLLVISIVCAFRRTSLFSFTQVVWWVEY